MGVSFKEKQGLVEAMNKTCKSKLSGRRKSQVMMNVRRMTMLPVDEMRKLSQMVANQPEDYPEVPSKMKLKLPKKRRTRKGMYLCQQQLNFLQQKTRKLLQKLQQKSRLLLPPLNLKTL